MKVFLAGFSCKTALNNITMKTSALLHVTELTHFYEIGQELNIMSLENKIFCYQLSTI